MRAKPRGARPLLASACALAAAFGAPAEGATGASTRLTVTAAPHVLSVTVNPRSIAFGDCRGGQSPSRSVMGFPNATCRAQALTITNSGAAATIDVQGAPFVGSSAGAPWTLCGAADGTTRSCEGGELPGTDQFRLRASSTAGAQGPFLSQSPQCDAAFSAGGCSVEAGAHAQEVLVLTGPSSATNPATTFTTTVTWTAVAP